MAPINHVRSALFITSVYPNGILAQDGDGSICFVPLREGESDLEKKFAHPGACRGEDPESLHLHLYAHMREPNWHVVPIRHSDVLAWIGEKGLEVYNLHDGTQMHTQLHGEKVSASVTRYPDPFQQLDAFDGETAISGIGIYDAKTGESSRFLATHLSAQFIMAA